MVKAGRDLADVNLSLTRAALTFVLSFQTSFYPASPSVSMSKETKPIVSIVCPGDETTRHNTIRLVFGYSVKTPNYYLHECYQTCSGPYLPTAFRLYQRCLLFDVTIS